MSNPTNTSLGYNVGSSDRSGQTPGYSPLLPRQVLGGSSPLIKNFARANHTHESIDQGGQLRAQALPNLDLSIQSLDNPYKFRVWRNAAANTGNGAFAIIAFDTEEFDTNNNVSGGIYTAPVGGFYLCNAAASVSAAAADATIAFFKNGIEYSRGGEMQQSTTGITVGDLIPLAAGETLDVRVYAASTKALNAGSISTNYFSGFLMSQT